MHRRSSLVAFHWTNALGRVELVQFIIVPLLIRHHPLTSDSDSLGTPASLNTDDTPSEGEHGQTTTALRTAVPPPTPRVQSDLPSPRKIRKSSIGNPVVFPPVAGSAPVTPVEFLPALRLSSYSSSSPELAPMTAREGRARFPFRISCQKDRCLHCWDDHGNSRFFEVVQHASISNSHQRHPRPFSTSV